MTPITILGRRRGLGLAVLAALALGTLAWHAPARLWQRFRDPALDWRSIATGGHFVGSPEAPVMITQFSDMTCGHCRALAATLSEVRSKHADVGLSYRHAIIVSDDATLTSARSLVCADRAGRFWETYQILTTQPLPSGSVESFARLADRAGLASTEFLRCIDDTATFDRIRSDAALARRLGITGTPLILVNGKTIHGNPPRDTLMAMIADVRRRAAVVSR